MSNYGVKKGIFKKKKKKSKHLHISHTGAIILGIHFYISFLDTSNIKLQLFLQLNLSPKPVF